MVTIMLAALLAIFGIVAVLAYVSNANARAVDKLKAAYVLIAVHPIASGTTLAQARHEKLLVRERMPLSSLPNDVVTSVTADNSNLVTSVNIPQGTLLVQTMLVTKTQRTGSLVVPPGMVAVTMQICLSADVGGYIKPGNKVAVYDTYATSKDTSLELTCNGGHQAPFIGDVATRMVLPNVVVLSVIAAPPPQSSTSTSATGLTGSAAAATQSMVYVTLAATPPQAKLLTLVNATGIPGFALTPQNIPTDNNPFQLK